MNSITRISKPFTWSYSKLKNHETCPKRHFHVDIARDVQEEESDQLIEGKILHDAMARRLDPAKKTPLPLGLDHLEPWADMLEKAAIGGRIGTEIKAALNRDFGSTTYFARDVWFRGVLDVLVVKGEVAIIADWKTGKVSEDNPQLALFAALTFAQRPEVKAVRTEFFWTRTMERSRKDFTRADMPGFWAEMLPRVARLEAAAATSDYPAKPGFLCRSWCPVAQCAYHGTRQ